MSVPVASVSLHEGSEIRAVVRSVDGAEAIVEVTEHGCGRCHEKGGCGGQQLTQMFCGGPRTYRVLNPLSAAEGETVMVAIAAGAVKTTANRAYVLPVLGLLLGAMAGAQWMPENDLASVAGAVFGLLGGWLAGSRIGRGAPLDRPTIISRC